MCDSCISKTILEQLAEPAVWFPVFTAVAAYFLQLWFRTVRKRKEDSAIAALYLYEIKKEIEVGVNRLEYLYTHAGEPFMSGEYRPIMPTQNWMGVRGIFPDEVFRRLTNAARHKGKSKNFEDLRFHLKNYYTVICKFGNDAILGNGPFDKNAARVDLDGSRMVLGLLEDAQRLMEDNAKRFFWPW